MHARVAVDETSEPTGPNVINMPEKYQLVAVETADHRPNPDPASVIEFAKLTEQLGSEEQQINTAPSRPVTKDRITGTNPRKRWTSCSTGSDTSP